MISVTNAFGKDTITKYGVRFLVDGQYDEDNQWVGGFYTPELSVVGTPLPNIRFYKESSGSSLNSDDYGERIVSSMKFTSRFRHPINSIINHNGTIYKITNEGDLARGGYWIAYGREDTATKDEVRLSEDWSEVPTDFTIQRGSKVISLVELAERRALCR